MGDVADPHASALTDALVDDGPLGGARAAEVISASPQLVIVHVGAAELVDRMWQLHHNLTAYDAAYVAAYVAAAESLGCSAGPGGAWLLSGQLRDDRSEGVCRVGAEDEVGVPEFLTSSLDLLGRRRRVVGQGGQGVCCA